MRQPMSFERARGFSLDHRLAAGEKFRRELLEESKEAGEASSDASVDELQALSTALCFLCSVNADKKVVEDFLVKYPEALLLEGASLLPEDSAKFILQQHHVRCHCQGSCRNNRVQVVAALDKGFGHFRSLQQPDVKEPKLACMSDLIKVERQIRNMRRQELLMRNSLLECVADIRTYQHELQGPAKTPRNKIKLLACKIGSPNSSPRRPESRLSVLEYQVAVASVNLRSLEQEHAAVLQKIRDDRRQQFAMLKHEFDACRRHDICSVGNVARNRFSYKKSSSHSNDGESEASLLSDTLSKV